MGRRFRRAVRCCAHRLFRQTRAIEPGVALMLGMVAAVSIAADTTMAPVIDMRGDEPPGSSGVVHGVVEVAVPAVREDRKGRVSPVSHESSERKPDTQVDHAMRWQEGEAGSSASASTPPAPRITPPKAAISADVDLFLRRKHLGALPTRTESRSRHRGPAPRGGRYRQRVQTTPTPLPGLVVNPFVGPKKSATAAHADLPGDVGKTVSTTAAVKPETAVQETATRDTAAPEATSLEAGKSAIATPAAGIPSFQVPRPVVIVPTETETPRPPRSLAAPKPRSVTGIADRREPTAPVSVLRTSPRAPQPTLQWRDAAAEELPDSVPQQQPGKSVEPNNLSSFISILPQGADSRQRIAADAATPAPIIAPDDAAPLSTSDAHDAEVATRHPSRQRPADVESSVPAQIAPPTLSDRSRTAAVAKRYTGRRPLSRGAAVEHDADLAAGLTRFLGTFVGPAPTKGSTAARGSRRAVAGPQPVTDARTRADAAIDLPPSTVVRPRVRSRWLPETQPETASVATPHAAARPASIVEVPAQLASLRLRRQPDSSPAGTESAADDLKPIEQIQASLEDDGGERPLDVAKARFDAAGQMSHPTGYSRTSVESIVMWEAPALSHRPLYFEEINLERHGHTAGVFQPVLSAAHFFGRVPALPYLMGAQEGQPCHYTLGHYRPGSCAPYRLYLPPLSLKGLSYEATSVLGLLYLIP